MFLKEFINKRVAKDCYRSEDIPIETFSDMLASDRVYSVSRFGDGEWNAMFGRAGTNCDGHAYFPEMGARLLDAVTKRKGYLYGMQDLAVRKRGRKIAGILKHLPVQTWFDAGVFHYASRDGKLLPFISQLRRKKVCIVGPAHLKPLSSIIPYDSFIEISATDCFLEIDRIEEEMTKRAARSGEGVVFSLSASMAANIIVHDLYDEIGDQHWILDLGSLWDVYVGVDSRSYHNNMSAETIRRNVGDVNNVF